MELRLTIVTPLQRVTLRSLVKIDLAARAVVGYLSLGAGVSNPLTVDLTFRNNIVITPPPDAAGHRLPGREVLRADMKSGAVFVVDPIALSLAGVIDGRRGPWPYPARMGRAVRREQS